MVADIMESHGWDAWFLGADTPLEDLLSLLQDKQPGVDDLHERPYDGIGLMAPLCVAGVFLLEHLPDCVAGMSGFPCQLGLGEPIDSEACPDVLVLCHPQHSSFLHLGVVELRQDEGVAGGGQLSVVTASKTDHFSVITIRYS